MPRWLNITERNEIVYGESKVPNTLPFESLYFNKIGCNLRFEVTPVWEQSERHKNNKLKMIGEKLNHCCK